jgi:hypothetical protein
MFEHHSQPLLPRTKFLKRQLIHFVVASTAMTGSLALGVLGYHLLEGFAWVDALLNASMGGMGPINELHTTAGKLFASFYALYSGVVFLVATGVLFGPIVHRFMHRFHIEEEALKAEQNTDNSGGSGVA